MAAGRAGKASKLPVALAREFCIMDVACEEAGGGFEDDGATQGVGPTLPGPARLAEAVGMEGNGLVAAAFPQLPCLLTAERED